jgi:hypothetical protein
MITSVNSNILSNTTVTSLSYIDSLISDASNKGLYYIKLDGLYITEDMILDLKCNYGYEVTTQYNDMGTYPVHTISWTNSNDSFPNYILKYDFSNYDSYSGGTQVRDLFENSNATLYGSPTYNAQYGGTISFNSTSSQYLINNNDLTQYFPGTAPNKSTAFSVVMSINASSNGIILGETSLAGWHNSVIEMVTGTTKFSLWDTGLRTVSSAIATPFNQWNHIVFTYDGVTMRGYVNGQNAGSTTLTRRQPYNDQPTPAPIYYQLAQADNTNAGDGTYGDFTLGRFELLDGNLSALDVAKKYNFHVNRFGA